MGISERRHLEKLLEELEGGLPTIEEIEAELRTIKNLSAQIRMVFPALDLLRLAVG